MSKKQSKAKRPSNNPNGRPKLDDTKIQVGVYVPTSRIIEASTLLSDAPTSEQIKSGKKNLRQILCGHLGL